MIRNFEIHNDRLKSVKYPKGVTGNVNTYVCHFDIACDIPNLLWFCIFKQGETVYRQIIENNTCKIPQEVLVNTEPLYIGCYGTNANDDIKRVSTNLIYFEVKEGAYSESTMPDTPTPDVWETLVSKTIPIIGENGNWFVYDITTGKYVDTGKPSQGTSSGEGGGSGGGVVDDKMSDTSTNAVQNKVIKEYVDGNVGDIDKLLDKILNPDDYPISNKEDIITPITVESGGIGYGNGNNMERSDAVRSAEYLKVSEGDTVYFINSIPSGTEVLRIICYDSNKNWVESFAADCEEEIKIPSSWAYLRFYRSDTSDTTMTASMVTKGDTVKAEFEKIYLKDSGYYIEPDTIDDETMHKIKIGSYGKDGNDYSILELQAPEENAAEATLCLMNNDKNNCQFVDFSSMVYDPNRPTVEVVCQTRGGHKLPEYSIRFNDGKGAGRVKKFVVHPDCIPVELTSEGLKVRKNNNFNNSGTDEEYLIVNFEALINKVETIGEIETALDNIIDIQNRLMGVSE